jgi:hypothetical protein
MVPSLFMYAMTKLRLRRRTADRRRDGDGVCQGYNPRVVEDPSAAWGGVWKILILNEDLQNLGLNITPLIIYHFS